MNAISMPSPAVVSSNKYTKLLTTIIFILKNSNQTHLNHFKIPSGYIHETLGELYLDMQKWADKLAETQHYKYLLEQKDTSFTATYYLKLENIPNWTWKMLDELGTKLTELNTLFHDCLGLQDAISNIYGQIQSYKFKVENLS